MMAMVVEAQEMIMTTMARALMRARSCVYLSILLFSSRTLMYFYYRMRTTTFLREREPREPREPRRVPQGKMAP